MKENDEIEAAGATGQGGYDSLVTLDWRTHIRRRPGMYIGKLGDGSNPDDGIYVIFKEVVDNAIDEHTQGYGKVIEIEVDEKTGKFRLSAKALKEKPEGYVEQERPARGGDRGPRPERRGPRPERADRGDRPFRNGDADGARLDRRH